MLRWVLTLALNRLFLAGVIFLAMKAFGVCHIRFEAPVQAWLDNASPFAEIISAMK